MSFVTLLLSMLRKIWILQPFAENTIKCFLIGFIIFLLPYLHMFYTTNQIFSSYILCIYVYFCITCTARVWPTDVSTKSLSRWYLLHTHDHWFTVRVQISLPITKNISVIIKYSLKSLLNYNSPSPILQIYMYLIHQIYSLHVNFSHVTACTTTRVWPVPTY